MQVMNHAFDAVIALGCFGGGQLPVTVIAHRYADRKHISVHMALRALIFAGLRVRHRQFPSAQQPR